MTNSSVEGLRRRHRGPVITAEDDMYDAARATFNGMIDRRPALVTRPLDVDDAVAAVSFALESELPVAVRGGGHGVAGHCVGDGSLVVSRRAPRLSGRQCTHRDHEVARADGGCSRPAVVLRPDQTRGLRQRRRLVVSVAYLGENDDGRKAIGALLDLPPVRDGARPMYYPELQEIFGRAPFGLRNYWSGRFLRALPDELIERVVGPFRPLPPVRPGRRHPPRAHSRSGVTRSRRRDRVCRP